MEKTTRALEALVLVLAIATCQCASVKADDRIQTYCGYCEEIGERYSISPELLESMCFYESGWNPSIKSSCGATGLMQVRPEFNQERMARLGITDLTDPYSNILCGADILSELSENYEVYEALCAYNSGEYSSSFKRTLNGGSCGYADKVLKYSAQLERNNGK